MPTPAHFEQWILDNEVGIRLGFFFGILLIMAWWESLAPRRPLSDSRTLRWLNNLGLVALNSLILRLLFPMAAAGVALWAQQQGWGLMQFLPLSSWGAILLAILILDFAIWIQHLMFHAIPALWRLHRVHHADLDYDVTTGARFHPVEIILSMLIKCAVILLMGPPVVAVILFEILLNATAMFNHGNVGLPPTLDRILRWMLVTPDMHRIHHSTADDEANSNFGFNLSWWDRLFGTYLPQPRKGHQQMQIGIHRYRNPEQVNRLPGMLILPFVGRITGYAINRRQWTDDQRN